MNKIDPILHSIPTHLIKRLYRPAQSIVLIEGDAELIRPYLSPAVAIVADPPYGISFQKGSGGRGLSENRHHDPILNDDVPFDPTPWLGFSSVALFGFEHFAHRLPNAGKLLVWDKTGGGRGPKDSFSDVEICWCSNGGERGSTKIISHLWKGLIRTGEDKRFKKFHVAQKPVEVMQRVLQTVPDGTVVCDPWAGSCSTAVAAHRSGYPALMIELDPSAFNVGARRLSLQIEGAASCEDVLAQSSVPLNPKVADPDWFFAGGKRTKGA